MKMEMLARGSRAVGAVHGVDRTDRLYRRPGMDLDTAPAPTARHAPEPPDPARRRLRGKAPELLLESALIVLSVLLGFAVNEWQQRQAQRELTRNVLANFRREIALNLRTLERIQPKHARLTERLRAAAAAPHGDSTAFQVFAARMEGEMEMVPLKEAAWEAASATGALRLLPYETSAALSETYAVQRGFLGSSRQRFSDRFFSPQNFEPASQRSVLWTQYMMMNEITQQEGYLIGIYRHMLGRLPRPRDGDGDGS
ncbi:MAG TPA: hypothetical protein VF771_03160 [Longimicrobiaceae bacterium]